VDHEGALQRIEGEWRGRSKLFLPGAQTRVCDLQARGRRFAGGRFVRIEYAWAFDGATQDGELVLCHEPGRDRWVATWVDSWHMSNTFMHCQGRLGVPIDLMGEYEVEGRPSWRWRTLVEPGERSLGIRMWNVSPDGGAVLAVESTLERSG